MTATKQKTLVLTVAGQELVLEHINFNDIKQGDTIAHLVEDDGVIHAATDAAVWVSTTTRFTEVGDSWYADGRKSATRNYDGTWSGWGEDTREDILAVASWHSTEDRHSVWKVVS